MLDDWKLQAQYERQIRTLSHDLNELKEKYDAQSNRNLELFEEGRACWQEALRFKQMCRKFRVLSVCAFILAVLFLSLSLYAFHQISIVRSSQPSSHSYSIGYNDALSGAKPDIESVQCHVCGYYSPDYHSEHINLFKVDYFWVPICSDCLDTHENGSLKIFGTDFFFSPISID